MPIVLPILPQLRGLALVAGLVLGPGCAYAGSSQRELAPEHPAATTSPAAEPSLFDPARHMRVSEVRPGMKGHGKTVFSGTRIERFDVEVVAVLHNFNPKYDVVLIRCHGGNLEQTGPIQGMSGSPIYLIDDRGRERMVGAFAYGWEFQRETLVGVQPIEYMLRLPEVKSAGTPPASGNTNGEDGRSPVEGARGQVRWSLADLSTDPLAASNRTLAVVVGNTLRGRSFAGEPRNPDQKRADSRPSERNSSSLRPLAAPLFVSGAPLGIVEELAPYFRDMGLTCLQAGGAAGGAAGDAEPAPIEPGAVLASPLLRGDMELTAVGTCTEVIGDTFVGFGHSFNNEGSVQLPVASGEISAVVAKLDQSFKLGASTKLRGTIVADQVMGIGGRLGDSPAGIPIDLRVTYADGSMDTAYAFTAALHPKLTPLVVGLATTASLQATRELPAFHTIDYALKLEFTNGRTIDIVNRAVNVDAGMLFGELALPLLAASENPFERVPVRRITGTIRVTGEAREAQILSVNVPKLKYRPGETIKGYVTYRPFRAREANLPFTVDLPRDLPAGEYQLVISDWQRYLGDEAQSRPFRFSAESADEVFDVIRDFTSIRHNAVYARLLRQPDGVAIGRVAMPRLPSSRRQVLLGAGRSNTTPFVSSTVRVFDCDYVIAGQAEFVITVESEAVVESGASAAPLTPAAPAAGQKHPEKLDSSPLPSAPAKNTGG